MPRLFFALPCPPMVAAQIDAWRQEQSFTGTPVATTNLHLTLAFLGHLPESRLAQLQRLPSLLPLTELAFDLRLDCLDCWPSGLLHLAPSQIPVQLLELVSSLNRQLHLSGLPCERRPYRPHLTLARDSRAPKARPPCFAWQVDELHLYRSEQGRYLSLHHWPLGALP